MRIGIDGRFLTHSQAGGFKTYSENLVGGFERLATNDEFVLYLDRERDPASEPAAHRLGWTRRVVQSHVPVIGMITREQFSLRSRANTDRLDVLHAPCNTAPLLTSVPLVLTLHDTIQVVEPQRFGHDHGRVALKQWAIAAYSRSVIRRAVQTARRIITVSNYEKSRIVGDLGVPEERVRVVHLAPAANFRPAPAETRLVWRNYLRQSLNLPERFVLGVGYEPRKNIPLLIEAFARCTRDLADPNLGLVLVAAEPASARQFVRVSQEWGIEQRVFVLPGMSHADLARLYNLAEVFVFPSTRESFGLPPLEALACGTPVITTSASSLPEVTGDAALLVEPGSVHALITALTAVLVNPSLRRQLADRGIARAQQFSWDRTAAATLSVYREAA